MSLSELDTRAFSHINITFQNDVFDMLMPFVTTQAYLVFLPFFIWILYKERKKALIILGIALTSLLVADWFANELKLYFERIRPCSAIDNVRLLVGCGRAFSFPSNHAVNAFAFAIPFYLMTKRRIRAVFFFIALLVGFSRVYVGVHYPSDVIAGGLFGTLMAFIMMKYYTWISLRFKNRPHTTLLVFFLTAFSLFRLYYILHGPLDLSPDEAHYWEWSRRLDMSYYSKGPMIAYLISLGTSLFGDTVLGIRIMALIFMGASSITLFYLGKKLYDETVGLASALILNIIPLFSTFGIIFTIDSPFIFFWILSLFLFWKIIELHTNGSDNPAPGMKEPHVSVLSSTQYATKQAPLAYWVLLGFSVGLGLLTKYTMALFYPCAALYMFLSKEFRKTLLTKGTFLMLFTSLLVFSPVIVWNALHDWVTFRHTLGQTHLSEGFNISPVSFIEFFGSQVGVVTPFFFVLIGVSIWKLRKDRRGAFLFWFAVPILGFFLLKSIQGKVQANWAMTGYITGIIAFSASYIRGFDTIKRYRKMLVIGAVVLACIVTALAHYPSVLNLPVHMDPTARLRGWKDLGKEVSRYYEQMQRSQSVFIFSDRYQVSSELAFYVKGNPTTYCINLGRRMNQYDLWPGFHDRLQNDAIFVRKGDRKIPDKIANAFSNVEKRVYKAYTNGHVTAKDYSIFLCHDFKGFEEKRPVKY